MKLFFRNIILLFFITLVAYLICVIVFSKSFIKNKIPNIKNLTGEGYCLQRFRDIVKYDKFDLLFLGPSHTYRGFDTRIFSENNISSFNMGSSNQSPLNSYYLVKHFLTKIHPQTIIFEVSSESLEIDGNESSIDLISNLPFSWDFVKMGLNTKNNIITINSMLNIYLNRIFYPLATEKQNLIKDDEYVTGGFVEFTGKSTYKGIIADPIIKPHRLIIEKFQIKYLQKLINIIKSKNINMIMVSTPIIPEYRQSIINYDENKEIIKFLALKNGIKYFDFNDSMYFNKMRLKSDKHFFDYTHLNKEGVRIFDKFFIENFL